ncbi:MazG nucleotide pyrophosphohydrolase domain-containing protein [Streptomyces sp. NRRL S-87]|uniref:MazG nucleotide pyrophosphohydrolase domain-containing protein n=1 Tax=Streptomyces sp. NRRL S-87 TaxID=1463920 RepID=UPI0004C12D57|nr:MazG nucleotide pyrophosphohydrolase domain-containing protein [Streptomyces sp. NRRL S-87]
MSVSVSDLVREFHEACGLEARDRPAEVSAKLARHRQDLIEEEVGELAEAAAEGGLAEFAHELADVVYVAFGTALVHGIDLEAVLAEVHRANMSKLGPDGRPTLRADGKVLKGDRYRAPDVAAVLRAQGWEPRPAAE